MWKGVTFEENIYFLTPFSLLVKQGFEVFGSFRWRSVPCSCLKSKQPNKEILSDPCFYFLLELFWLCVRYSQSGCIRKDSKSARWIRSS